jgi:hypothetical protein
MLGNPCLPLLNLLHSVKKGSIWEVYVEKVRAQIVGAWSVVSAVIDVDGKTTDLFGPSPQGQFIFTGDGYFSLFISRSGRPQFSSNSIKAGTTKEFREAMTGLISLVGSYTITPDGTQTLHIVGSSFPNWEGAEQKRLIQVTGDEMRYTNPTSPTGSGTVVILLKRAK